jgi:hypothetical protein
MAFIEMVEEKAYTIETDEDLREEHLLTGEILMRDGRLVAVEPGGMVDVAYHELGAEIVEVEVLEDEPEASSESG